MSLIICKQPHYAWKWKTLSHARVSQSSGHSWDSSIWSDVLVCLRRAFLCSFFKFSFLRWRPFHSCAAKVNGRKSESDDIPTTPKKLLYWLIHYMWRHSYKWDVAGNRNSCLLLTCSYDITVSSRNGSNTSRVSANTAGSCGSGLYKNYWGRWRWDFSPFQSNSDDIETTNLFSLLP